jgi:anti-anti-sigma regulatory factor
MLHRTGHLTSPLPDSIRAIEDIRGVRVIRLRGPVGRDAGPDADATDQEAARAEDVFDRPVLFDFKEATDCDSATVAYLIRALRRRLAAHMPVGIVNTPPDLAAELEIMRVEPLFLVFRTEEEAVAGLAAAAATSQKPSGC